MLELKVRSSSTVEQFKTVLNVTRYGILKYMLTLDDIRRVTHTSIETFQGQRAFTRDVCLRLIEELIIEQRGMNE